MDALPSGLPSLAASPKPTSTPPVSSPSHTSSRSRRTPPHSSRQTLAARARGVHGTARRLSFGSSASRDSGDGAGFTFSPTLTPNKPLSHDDQLTPSLDLSEIKHNLEAITTSRSPQEAPRRIAGLRPRGTRRLPLARRAQRCGIQDLPDELLLKIFSKLDEQQGFRPFNRHASTGPEWYNPPLRIALVCTRWLPIARQLFYRSLKIHHLERITALHETLTSTNLSLRVRHLSINLPYSSFGKLSLPSTLPPSTAGILSTAREPDSDLDSSTQSKCEKKKKPRPPVTAQDQLRTVFQSCSQLLSLEISGVAPPVLFSSSSVVSASLHHLHQLRLSTISTLTLKGDSDSQILDSTTLRQALLALNGLRSLTIKGYVSDSSSPLDFAPTSTLKGSPARPLPSRARALFKLKSIAILESAMNPLDLETLLRQVQHGSIEELVVTDHYDAKQSRDRIRRGRYGGTTIEGLSRTGVGQLVSESLGTLRVTLHNFPLSRDALGPAVSTASSSSTPPPRRFPGTHVAFEPDDPPYILDRFIGSLASLRTLDVGGSLVSANLLAPAATPPCGVGSSPSSSSSLARTGANAASLIPATVESLTIRACPALTPRVVATFLESLAGAVDRRGGWGAGANRLDARRSSLKTLRVVGGSESGWRNPVESWRVQKACWDAGIEWWQGGGTTTTTTTSASRTVLTGRRATSEWRQGRTARSSGW